MTPNDVPGPDPLTEEEVAELRSRLQGNAIGDHPATDTILRLLATLAAHPESRPDRAAPRLTDTWKHDPDDGHGHWYACLRCGVDNGLNESRPDPGEGLREAATRMVAAYTDIEGDVINGRTDAAYAALRAALAPPVPTDRPEPIDEERLARAIYVAYTHTTAPNPNAPFLATLIPEILAAYRTEPGETPEPERDGGLR